MSIFAIPRCQKFMKLLGGAFIDRADPGKNRNVTNCSEFMENFRFPEGTRALRSRSYC